MLEKIKKSVSSFNMSSNNANIKEIDKIISKNLNMRKSRLNDNITDDTIIYHFKGMPVCAELFLNTEEDKKYFEDMKTQLVEKKCKILNKK